MSDSPMTVREIIKKYLEDNGFDGLCNINVECGCRLDDLCPCQENCFLCEPGYDQGPSKGGDFFIYPGKKGGE